MDHTTPATGSAKASLSPRLGLCSIAYFATQLLAFRFPDSFGLVSAIWPAAGVALAAALLTPRRQWRPLMACLFVAGMAANLTTTRPVLASLGFMVANICETALAAWMITNVCGESIAFTRVRDVMALLVVGVVVNGTTALIGAASAALAIGAPFWNFYATWWVADGLGLVLITPLIVGWTVSWRTPMGWHWDQWIEAALMLVIGCGTAWVVFGMPRLSNAIEIRPYLLLVFVVWSAIKYGPGSTATLLAALSVIAVGCTAAGLGYFPLGGADGHLRLLSVQVFLGVVGMTGLLLSAAIAQQRDSEMARRGAEGRFAAVANSAPVLIWEAGIDKGCHYFNKTWLQFTGRSLAQESGNGWAEGVHPEDLARCLEIYVSSFDARQEFQMEYRLRRHDGAYRWLLDHGVPRYGPTGAFLGYIGSCVDITEHKEHEAALREGEHRFRSFVNQAAEAFFAHDLDGRFTEVNERACERLGYTRGELLQMRVFDVEQDIDRASAREAWESIQPGECRETRGYHRRKDGGMLPVAARRSCTELRGQRVVMSVVQDLTERAQVEANLHRIATSNIRLRESLVKMNMCPDLDAALACLVEHAVKLAGMDSGAVYLIENQSAVLKHHRGLPEEFAELVASRPLHTGYIRRALERPREIHNVIALFPEHNRLGAHHGMRHVYCVALSADGRPFGYLNVVSVRTNPPDELDIELVRLLAQGAESVFVRLGIEQELRAVLTSVAEGIIVQAADGTISDCNPSAERILGLTRSQLQGGRLDAPCWKASREDGRPFPGEEHPATECLRTGQPRQNIVMHLELPDGSRKWVNVSASPMFKSGEGRSHAVVVSMADLTARRQLEERLRQSQKMEGIGHLAGGMAHEFNNILAAILMNAAMARMNDSEQSPGSHLEEIEKLSQRAAGLIKQLLAFSRRSIMTARPLDLERVLSEQTGTLGRLLGERIVMEVSVMPKLPPAHADKASLEQVLLNLCLNARDAMPDGGTLRLALTVRDVTMGSAAAQEGHKSGRYVCLAVSDTGCGMDQHVLKRLFEPFFTTKDVGRGTGLGLAMVRGIAEQHHGWVEVETEVGKGSTFRVYFPAELAEPARSRTYTATGPGACPTHSG